MGVGVIDQSSTKSLKVEWAVDISAQEIVYPCC
jgi:hypothetical protein